MNALEICIRGSKPDEGERLVSIWRAAVEETHDFLAPGDLDALERDTRAYLLSAALWVATDRADRPIGFMSLSRDRLDALFVDPECRGRGVGRALVSFAASIHPVLDTEVNEQNEQALGFYRRLGFVETSRSPFDDDGRPYPLVRMRRERGTPPTGAPSK